MAKADSGASRHYIRTQDTPVLNNVQPTSNGPLVNLPNNSTIKAEHIGHLPFDSTQISPTATKAYALPGLASASLLSLGQLCDDNCKVILDQHKLQLYKDDKIILQGHRNVIDGLWDIPIKNYFITQSIEAHKNYFNTQQTEVNQ